MNDDSDEDDSERAFCVESFLALFAEDGTADCTVDRSREDWEVAVTVALQPKTPFVEDEEDERCVFVVQVVDPGFAAYAAPSSKSAENVKEDSAAAAASSGGGGGGAATAVTAAPVTASAAAAGVDDGLNMPIKESPPVVNGGDDGTRTAAVRTLCPVRLSVKLGPEFPNEDSMPSFRIHAPWLEAMAQPGDRKLNAMVRSRFAALWEECKDDGVGPLFEWVNFLQNECFAELFPEWEVPNSQVTLEFEQPCPNTPKGGPGASEQSPNSSHTSSASSMMKSYLNMLIAMDEMVNYDKQVDHKRWIEAEHECEMCSCDVKGTQMSSLACTHNFCRECLTKMAVMHVTEGQIANLCCPFPDCQMYLGDDVVRTALESAGDPEEVEKLINRWQEFAFRKGLESMVDACTCPKCKSPAFKEDETLAECAVCHLFFCPKCMAKSHGETPCESDVAKAETLRAELEANKISYDEWLLKQRQLAENAKSARLVEGTSKQCPTCSAPISKNGGCNKMTCWRCEQYFCWTCNQRIKGYDHFSNSRCVLFDEDEIRRFDQAMEAGEFRELFARRNGVQFDPNNAAHRGDNAARGRNAAQHQPYQRGRGCFCPNCRYMNPRTGPNNHVTCVNCRVKFCMQCSARVRNAAQHYRAGARCKQHNAD